MSKRAFIINECLRMAEGQSIVFAFDMVRKAFRAPPLVEFIHEPPLVRLFSNLPSSAWGAWSYEIDPVNDYLKIYRHKPADKKRVFADWDRRHLHPELYDKAGNPKPGSGAIL